LTGVYGVKGEFRHVKAGEEQEKRCHVLEDSIEEEVSHIRR
jgi:hypothetical protein